MVFKDNIFKLFTRFFVKRVKEFIKFYPRRILKKFNFTVQLRAKNILFQSVYAVCCGQNISRGDDATRAAADGCLDADGPRPVAVRCYVPADDLKYD